MLSSKNGTGLTISDENGDRLFTREFRELTRIEADYFIGF